MNNNTSNTDQEKSNGKEGIVFTLTSLPLFFFIVLSYILYRNIKNNYPAELAFLNGQYYHTVTLALYLPFFLFFSTLVIYESFQIAGMSQGEKFQLHRIDFRAVLLELFAPTSRKYKVRKVLLILFLIISFLALIASQLYFYISMIYLL
ncbi:MAG: hypothetical protein JXA54_15860 [Candidatus Heimdallarchaeota archaeon]|nr:hypothetical protein [Candidatus Heimdallarchaeota archaeon]